MGNAANCSATLDVVGNPDVTGFGVLISFSFSIVLVIGAMIWAYLTDRLPYECYNGFDNLILKREPRADDGRRVETFRGFLLAMSDQQLLSGLALVITINLIRNGVADLDTEITGYAYNNAVILAYFSCTIHLATLGSLRGYMQKRGFLKHARVVLMVCVFGLLLQGLVDAWWSTLYYDAAVRCAAQQLTGTNAYLNTGPHLSRMAIWDDIALIAGFAIWLGILASGYLRRILALYSAQLWKPFSTWQVKLASSTRLLPDSVDEAHIVRARASLAERWSESKLDLGFFFLVVLPAFNQSFIFEIIWMLFYFFFGIGQFAYYITAPGSDYKLSSKISLDPDFGQLLPLVLLGLPLLAMVEGHSDSKSEANNATKEAFELANKRTSGHSSLKKEIPGFQPLQDYRNPRRQLHLRIQSWVLAATYLLFCICIAISLAYVGNYSVDGDSVTEQRFEQVELKENYGAFATFLFCAAWLCISFAVSMVRFWQLRKEVWKIQSEGASE